MECKLFPFGNAGEYVFADVVALHKGKWVFCQHKKRKTWEHPGGHIEIGETPLEAAKRELFEETGAIDFDIEPLCDYWVLGDLNGTTIEGNGQVYFANIHTFSSLPAQSEMKQIQLFENLPNDLTYPEHTYAVYPLVEEKRKLLVSADAETFAIPGAGGILLKSINNVDHILLQTRSKPDAPTENGLLEIPAGKTRAFENIFDTLKREVKEETGLDVVEIFGESSQTVYESNDYKVINFTPYSCSQNTAGTYPIMVFVFICRVTGDLLPFSDESRDYKWTTITEVKRMITDSPESFYPMHVDTLRKYVKDQ